MAPHTHFSTGLISRSQIPNVCCCIRNDHGINFPAREHWCPVSIASELWVMVVIYYAYYRDATDETRRGALHSFELIIAHYIILYVWENCYWRFLSVRWNLIGEQCFFLLLVHFYALLLLDYLPRLIWAIEGNKLPVHVGTFEVDSWWRCDLIVIVL